MTNKINNTNTIDTNNINYRNSGLYINDNFFNKHDRVFDFTDQGYLEFDQYEKLLEENNYFEDEVQEYIEQLDEEDKNKDEVELKQEASDEIIKSILLWTIYFEPAIFDKKIAKKCHLIAFKYNDKELLALNGCGMNLSQKLDAYQALTDNTIDKYSTFFSQYDYFKYVVSESVAEEVKQAITKYK